METVPEFYVGSPVEPVDLRFRDEFVAELWQSLRTGHVVLTAPRRTGKTSVMDHLRDHPVNEFQVVSINVQDLTHPADFFQVLLDAFHDAHPDFLRDQLAAGWELVGAAFDRVDSVGGRRLQARATRKRSRLAQELAPARRHVPRPSSRHRRSDSLHHRRVPGHAAQPVPG